MYINLPLECNYKIKYNEEDRELRVSAFCEGWKCAEDCIILIAFPSKDHPKKFYWHLYQNTVCDDFDLTDYLPTITPCTCMYRETL
jgi:hypothetical protein